MEENKIDNYEFTNNWFDTTARPIWAQIINQSKPKKILEIGSYEGASTCFLINTLSLYHNDIEIHAIDTWDGGVEHKEMKINMKLVEKRFKKNTSIAKKHSKKNVELITYKKKSIHALSELITKQKSNYFDFVYIDGSHMAADVLSDAILSFELLKVKGIMGFDDYLWQLPKSNTLLTNPKIAIDSFTNIFAMRTGIFNTPNHQLYIQKLN